MPNTYKQFVKRAQERKPQILEALKTMSQAAAGRKFKLSRQRINQIATDALKTAK